MITLFTGVPGSGKTAALIDLLVRELTDVPLYVHFDPTVKRRPDLVPLHESLTLAHQPVHADKWHLELPDACTLIIDEVQDVWRPRGPGSKVPDAIAALEVHRHSGNDIYLTTQSPKLVDSNVRALVGRHVHIRDLGFLGRWWYEWPECADNCSNGWKNAPIKKRYKLPKSVFSLYKSASVHIKPIRSFPKMFVLAMVALVAVALLSYRAYSSVRDKLHPQAAAAVVASPAGFNASASKGGPVVKMTPAEYVASYQPRLEGLPQTAPRYDEVTAPKIAPYPAACVSMGARCDCFTQQATKLPVARSLCLQIVKDGFFNDWQAIPSAVPVAPAERLTGGNLPDAKPTPDVVAAAAVAAGDADVRQFMKRSKAPSL